VHHPPYFSLPTTHHHHHFLLHYLNEPFAFFDLLTFLKVRRSKKFISLPKKSKYLSNERFGFEIGQVVEESITNQKI
jgi:hypothetical protein